ncbi:hypothetical protein H0H81_008680 [Sphagnurus paluster]|uniref:Uncharacterized protein n=1 Tax=Sphagnurus paluster TaxID=117069 RepID=A0A9P7K8L9_9AGAR|nr:hypothetical protein H0H81_008680 [Sphagnurus paluster]
MASVRSQALSPPGITVIPPTPPSESGEPQPFTNYDARFLQTPRPAQGVLQMRPISRRQSESNERRNPSPAARSRAHQLPTDQATPPHTTPRPPVRDLNLAAVQPSPRAAGAQLRCPASPRGASPASSASSISSLGSLPGPFRARPREPVATGSFLPTPPSPAPRHIPMHAAPERPNANTYAPSISTPLRHSATRETQTQARTSGRPASSSAPLPIPGSPRPPTYGIPPPQARRGGQTSAATAHSASSAPQLPIPGSPRPPTFGIPPQAQRQAPASVSNSNRRPASSSAQLPIPGSPRPPTFAGPLRGPPLMHSSVLLQTHTPASARHHSTTSRPRIPLSSPRTPRSGQRPASAGNAAAGATTPLPAPGTPHPPLRTPAPAPYPPPPASQPHQHTNAPQPAAPPATTATAPPTATATATATATTTPTQPAGATASTTTPRTRGSRTHARRTGQLSTPWHHPGLVRPPQTPRTPASHQSATNMNMNMNVNMNTNTNTNMNMNTNANTNTPLSSSPSPPPCANVSEEAPPEVTYQRRSVASQAQDPAGAGAAANPGAGAAPGPIPGAQAAPVPPAPAPGAQSAENAAARGARAASRTQRRAARAGSPSSISSMGSLPQAARHPQPRPSHPPPPDPAPAPQQSSAPNVPPPQSQPRPASHQRQPIPERNGKESIHRLPLLVNDIPCSSCNTPIPGLRAPPGPRASTAVIHAICPDPSCRTIHCRGCAAPVSCRPQCNGKHRCAVKNCCPHARAIAIYVHLATLDHVYLSSIQASIPTLLAPPPGPGQQAPSARFCKIRSMFSRDRCAPDPSPAPAPAPTGPGRAQRLAWLSVLFSGADPALLTRLESTLLRTLRGVAFWLSHRTADNPVHESVYLLLTHSCLPEIVDAFLQDNMHWDPADVLRGGAVEAILELLVSLASRDVLHRLVVRPVPRVDVSPGLHGKVWGSGPREAGEGRAFWPDAVEGPGSLSLFQVLAGKWRAHFRADTRYYDHDVQAARVIGLWEDVERHALQGPTVFLAARQ